MFDITEQFYKYIGSADSLKGYSRSYKLVFFKLVLTCYKEHALADCMSIARDFRKFYSDRIMSGKISDKNVDIVIKNANESSIEDIHDLIVRNPYKFIRNNGFISCEKVNDGVAYELPKELLNSLTENDYVKILKVLDAKIELYFDKIDTNKDAFENILASPDFDISISYETCQLILESWNKYYKRQFEQLSTSALIENIICSDSELKPLGAAIGMYLRIRGINNLYEIKETVSIFLVRCAKSFYNDGDGGIWDNTFKCLNSVGSEHVKKALVSVYGFTLKLYRLNKFPSGANCKFTILNPIIRHAGLPKNIVGHYLKIIEALYYDQTNYYDMENSAYIECKYKSDILMEHMKYLTEQGELVDTLMRDIDMFDSLKNGLSIDHFLASDEFKKCLIQWMDQNKDNENIKNIKRMSVPELYYDIDNAKVLLKYRGMTMQDCGELLVEVNDGGQISKRKWYGRQVNNEYIYGELVLPLMNCSSIYVKLYDGNKECLGEEYEIKNKSEIIKFNKHGRVIVGKYLPEDVVYFLSCDQCNVGDGFDIISFDCNYYVYSFDGGNNSIAILELDSTIFEFNVKKGPKIIGGALLMDGNAEFTRIDSYEILPNLLVPGDREWSIKIIRNNEEVVEINKNMVGEISVADLIEEAYSDIEYGEYSIKFINKNLGATNIKFAYLPEIKLTRSSWMPSCNGYGDQSLKFDSAKCNKYNMQLFINGEENSDVLIDINATEIFGCVQNCSYKYPFKIITKALVWDVSSESKIFGDENMTVNLSTKDLGKSEWVNLQVKNNLSEDVYLNIMDDEQIFMSRKVGGKRLTLVNLKEYMESMSAGAGLNTRIVLQQDYKDIMILCKVKSTLNIYKVQEYNDDNGFCVNWSEDGSCKDREIIFRNSYNPIISKVIRIEDGVKSVSLEYDNILIDGDLVAEIRQVSANAVDYWGDVELKSIINSSCAVYIGRAENCSVVKDHTYEEQVVSFLFHMKKVFRFNMNSKYLNDERLNLTKLRYINGDEKLYNILFSYEIDKAKFERISAMLNLDIPIFNSENEKLSDSAIECLYKYDKITLLIYAYAHNNLELLFRLFQESSRYQDAESWSLSKLQLIYKALYDNESFTTEIYYKSDCGRQEDAFLEVLCDSMLDNCDSVARIDLQANQEQIASSIRMMKNLYYNTLTSGLLRNANGRLN